MVFFPAIARIFALAVAATAFLTGGAASADSIYTVTATGVIDDVGQDYGIFGNPYGTDLTGQTFTITESFDLDQSTLNQGDQNEDVGERYPLCRAEADPESDGEVRQRDADDARIELAHEGTDADRCDHEVAGSRRHRDPPRPRRFEK